MDPVTISIYAGLTAATAISGAAANYKKSQVERKEQLNKQALRMAEAAEMRRRQSLNLELLQRKIMTSNQDALSNFSQSSSGGAGGLTSETFKQGLFENAAREMERAKVESDYEIMIRQSEADIAGKTAAEINRLTPYSFASSAIGGAKDFYSIYVK
jgi:uncharacterized protein YaiL (DUF2058 family)